MLTSYVKRSVAEYLIYAHVDCRNCEPPEPMKVWHYRTEKVIFHFTEE